MKNIQQIFKYILVFILFFSAFNLCGCKKNNQEDNYNYSSEVVLSYNKSLTSTTLSQTMKPSRPIYFGMSVEFNNETRNSKTYNTCDFYFVFTQKTTAGDEVENTYNVYSYYTSSHSSSFTIASRENKYIALWSNNACYLNGTGNYSIPKKVSLYYAGQFIATFVPQYA